jgi:hypothetical protein
MGFETPQPPVSQYLEWTTSGELQLPDFRREYKSIPPRPDGGPMGKKAQREEAPADVAELAAEYDEPEDSEGIEIDAG